jgi:uncharacterized protein YjbJ (UPF0337 family)
MSTVNAVKNKVKGQWKQVKGNVNQNSGKGLKGGMQKIGGKIQEGLGDLELNETTNKTTKPNRPRNRDTI